MMKDTKITFCQLVPIACGKSVHTNHTLMVEQSRHACAANRKRDFAKLTCACEWRREDKMLGKWNWVCENRARTVYE